jgi:hypothetical protein
MLNAPGTIRVVQVEPMKPMLKPPGTNRAVQVEPMKPMLKAPGTNKAVQAEPMKPRLKAPGTNRAVQVEPMKYMLKAPGIQRLKLFSDELPSNFAFKFDLRRYTWAPTTTPHAPRCSAPSASRQGLTLVHFSAQRKRFCGMYWVPAVE